MRIKSTTKLLVLTLIITLFSSNQAEEKKGVRVIPIPKRDHAYQHLPTQVASSEKEMNLILEKFSSQHSNNKSKFAQALRQAKINFEQEQLLLISHQENSGSNQVNFLHPLINQDKLICFIARKPAKIGTSDMAYYCFALAVQKKIKKLDLQILKVERTETLALEEKKPKRLEELPMSLANHLRNGNAFCNKLEQYVQQKMDMSFLVDQVEMQTNQQLKKHPQCKNHASVLKLQARIQKIKMDMAKIKQETKQK